MHIILIRHGITEWNAQKRSQGHADIPLNALGREQARLAGERLRAMQGLQIQAIYSSDTARAWQTAQIIGEHVGNEPQPMFDLREIDVGQWGGLTVEERNRLFPDSVRDYECDPINTVLPGGESRVQLQERALRAFNQIVAAHQPDETVLAVSHAGTMRAILCYYLGMDMAYNERLKIDHCSFTELRCKADNWRVHRVNDAAHEEGL